MVFYPPGIKSDKYDGCFDWRKPDGTKGIEFEKMGSDTNTSN